MDVSPSVSSARRIVATLSDERPARSSALQRMSERAALIWSGVILQSPLNFDATLTPMDGRAVEAVVSALAVAGISLPGINGDATTAASFAGQWSERMKSAATPFQGSRLYECLELSEATDNKGMLRLARPSDRSLMMEWFRAFSIEVGELANDLELRVDRWISSAELWLWDDRGPMSMAVGRKPAEGVVRISGVYTPTGKRNRATLRRAFVRFQSICAILAFAVYFTQIWRTPHPILFTAALAIGQ